MDAFWKAIGLVLISAVLGLTLEKCEKDYAVVLSMAVCSITATLAFSYLEPVLLLLQELETIIKQGNDILRILLKAAGISLVAELAAMMCSDAGNASLGKILQILGTAAILCMSVPIFQSLLTIIRDILGEL